MNQTESVQQRAQRLADEWVRLILTHSPQILLSTSITQASLAASGGEQHINAQAIYDAAKIITDFHKTLEHELHTNLKHAHNHRM